MTIGNMREEHVAALAELEKVCFPEPWSEHALREELHNPAALFLVAQGETGEVLGYVGCQTVLDEGYITNVAAHPAARRQGVGRTLVAALLEHARARALSFVTLEVRVSNAPAIALYEQAGFRPVGTRRNYYSAPCEDALLMTRDL